MGIVIPLLLITVCCLVIWRAGDGFMTASEYVGRHLSEGVRGATINAIASSMPEVFTSFFFLFVLMDASGFTGGIGTTAGSAIFNGMVIPAVSVLAVIGIGMAKRIEVSKKVLLRDGIALIIAEFIFLVLISGASLDWYHGLLLMGVYFIYLAYMLLTMKKKDRDKFIEDGSDELTADDFENEDRKKRSIGVAVITFDLERIFLGKGRINDSKAWALLVFSTISIALVSYLLVVACEWLGEEHYDVPYIGTFEGLNIPVMFVALILASAASSFPDTIISIKDAQKGQYDDAISNALGSNIFDVCFALGFPLLIFTLIKGPIQMPPELIDLSTELRFLLWLLTIVAVVIYTTGKYIGRTKAIVLLVIYFLFVLYIVGRGANNPITTDISEILLGIVRYFRIA